MASVLGQLQANVSLNLPQPKAPVSVCELKWGEDVSSFHPPFDVIIAADVIYQHMEVDCLIKTLDDLSNHKTLILIAYESHDAKTPELFEQRIRKKFSVENIPVSEHDDVYNKKTISLIQLKKI